MSITKNIDNHTHIDKSKIKIFPPFPDAVKIEITGRCNLDCSFCAVPKNLREVGDMDRGLFTNVLGQLKEIGVKQIGLFLLGESFLLYNIDEYIDEVKTKFGFEYCFITTNGTLCHPQRLLNTIDAGLDSLKFSINAWDRESYHKIHGKDLFDTVVKNIKWLGEYNKTHKKKVKTALSSIFYPEHEKELRSFHKEMSEYVDETYFLPFLNMAGHVKGGGQVGNVGRMENPSKPVPCWVLFNASKITWDGYLTACYSDNDERFKLGNLNEKTVLECWYGMKATNLRLEHINNSFAPNSLCAKCLGIE